MKTDWMDDALCAEIGPELFFADGIATRARKICGSCEVVNQCLKFALDNNEEHGIWGNTSPLQRKNMRKDAA